MKKYLTVFLVIIVVVSFAVTAFAADMPTKPTPAKATRTSKTIVRTGTRPSTYPAGPIQKAERGFMNVAFGWTEIPKRIVDKTKQYNNPIKGTLLGVFQGSCKAFARTASGAFDLVTFPVGRYDKPHVIPDMPAAQ